MWGFSGAAQLRFVLALLGAAVFAGALYAQPPMTGYTNAAYSSGTGLGDQIEDVIIRRGSTTLLSNTNTGGAASPYNTFYSGIAAANLVPGVVHQLVLRPGSAYTQQFTAYIDYNNNGSFQDTGEVIMYTTTSIATTTSFNFTPQGGVGGVRRLRVRAVWSTSGPHHSTQSYSYGEAEDYLVNLGFAITTAPTLPTGALTLNYSTNIEATNGTAPYNWNTNITGLPPGITASQPSGQNHLVLSGTPTQTGTYNFTIFVTDSAPEQISRAFTMNIVDPPTALPYSTTFAATTHGWVLDTGWQVGAAVAYTGSTATGPTRSEPGNDKSQLGDNRILGHMIGADYPNNMTSTVWASSPFVNCTANANVRLSFWRWMGLSPGDEAMIQVSNNGGASWNNVWVRPVGTTINTPTDWQLISHDITQWAAGYPVVQVRFGIGPTDASIQNVGWCIDDVTIDEPGPDLLVYEDGAATGTLITDNQAVGGLRDFGMVNVGQNSQVLQIELVNNGVTVLTGFNWSKTGTDPGKFVIITSPASSIQPGASTVMEVQFNSNAGGAAGAGVYTCTINLPHNGLGSGSSPFEINVRAEAVQPVPDLEVRLGSATGTIIGHGELPGTTPRNFGDQDISAGPTAAITIFMVNAGTGPVNITTPDMGGTWHNQYVVNSTGFLSTLAAGQSTSVTVAFDPSSVGPKDAMLRIAHSDSSKQSPYEVPVTGVGTSSAVAILGVYEGGVGGTSLNHDDAPAGARDFGDQVVSAGPTAPITITIQNSGGVDMTMTNPVLGGANPGDFILDLTGFVNPLPGGATTSFTIAFDPTSVGQKNATVTFTHNDATVTSPFIINVTGNGVLTSPSILARAGGSGGAVITNPAAATGVLNFGTRDILAGPSAAVEIYVENSGTANLTLGAPTFVTATTHYILDATGFSGSVAVGATRSFTITFDPSTVGTHDATISFTHNDNTTGTPFLIDVTGIGELFAPAVEVREGSVAGTLVDDDEAVVTGGGRDLGTIDVGAGATAAVTLFIMNAGTQPLVLSTPVLAGPNATDFALNVTGFNTNVAAGASTTFQVTFDPALGGFKDAVISFTHNDTQQPSPFSVLVRGRGTDATAVMITTTTLPGGVAGTIYPTTTLQATQGTGPYTWSLYDGRMPPGLTLSPAGTLSGTPTGFGGLFTLVLRVQDSTGATDERQFSINIGNGLLGSGRASGGGCVAATGGSFAIFGLLAVVAAIRRRRKA